MSQHHSAATDTLYLRMDEYHHRIAIYAADRDGVRYIGWQVDDAAALERCAERLGRQGIRTVFEPASVAAERAVQQVMSFADSEGFRHELFYGQQISKRPFRPQGAVSGFVTGRQGLGHVVLGAENRAALVEFFQSTFEFKLSDTITLHGVDINFLRCNERHHTLAIMSPGLGVSAGELHHLLLEVQHLDDVGRVYDLVQAAGMPLILTLGRHVNDHMVSFYMKTPSGVGIEVGWGGRTVDERTWVPSHYDHAAIWGHTLAG